MRQNGKRNSINYLPLVVVISTDCGINRHSRKSRKYREYKKRSDWELVKKIKNKLIFLMQKLVSSVAIDK